jgi:hypothetical protein
MRYQKVLREYFGQMYLELIIDEAEGYAYLRQRAAEEDELGKMVEFPRLMSRRKLSYPLSLMLVLLRKRMLEFEMAGDDARLVLSQREIIDMMRAYWDELETNERKRVDQTIQHIKRLESYGFLHALKSEQEVYEVNRILKAYIPLEKLKEMLEKLGAYALERDLISHDGA